MPETLLLLYHLDAVLVIVLCFERLQTRREAFEERKASSINLFKLRYASLRISDYHSYHIE